MGVEGKTFKSLFPSDLSSLIQYCKFSIMIRIVNSNLFMLFNSFFFSEMQGMVGERRGCSFLILSTSTTFFTNFLFIIDLFPFFVSCTLM